jgi:hypothetical protein
VAGIGVARAIRHPTAVVNTVATLPTTAERLSGRTALTSALKVLSGGSPASSVGVGSEQLPARRIQAGKLHQQGLEEGGGGEGSPSVRVSAFVWQR